MGGYFGHQSGNIPSNACQTQRGNRFFFFFSEVFKTSLYECAFFESRSSILNAYLQGTLGGVCLSSDLFLFFPTSWQCLQPKENEVI